MREKIKTALAILVIMIILPYIITYMIQGNDLFLFADEKEESEINTDEPVEKLIGVLASQISMDAPKEAVKAQAVLVRTEYYRCLEEQIEPEQSLSMEELTNLWGSEYVKKNYKMARDAVRETAGLVLTYDGKLIQPAYHKVSAGATRAMKDAQGKDIVYLTSVPCEQDIMSQDYLSVRFFSKDVFAKALNIEESQEYIIRSEADDTGYVNQIMINDHTYSGDEIREALELPSPCFYIKEVENKIRVVVKGKGHGIGLSQYAAAKQAEKGASFQEILTYFFHETKLEKYVMNRKSDTESDIYSKSY